MSVKLMSETWSLVLTSGQRDVLLVLADHANDDGICWPSVPLIAWKTDKHPRSIKRTMRELEESGLVECVANEAGGRGLSRRYQLHLEKGVRKSPFSAETFEREEDGTLTSGTTTASFDESQKGDVSSPIPKRVTSEDAQKKGDADARKGDLGARNGDIAMSPEPSRTTNEPPNPPGDAKSVGPDHGQQTFEILQLIFKPGKKYPNRVRGHLAKEVKKLLEEGFTYHQVLEGAKRWEAKGLNPGTLPSFVNEVVNGDLSRNGNGHKPFDPESQNYEDAQIR